MRPSLYLDAAIAKRLEQLRRSGKKAALAAAKTEEIIVRLKAGGEIAQQAGTVTKHGELRIKGVVKYDLGSGYRLVALRQKFRIFLLYVGSHDDCHRWIENNRDLGLEQIENRCTRLITAAVEGCTGGSADAALPGMEELEDDPLGHVSERDLRQIFCGLAQGDA